jgi:serine phosphatase RsbU (regulator of sigma subunit)/anti-sigma regulatory factor (Ser/Thr protein kinase)
MVGTISNASALIQNLFNPACIIDTFYRIISANEEFQDLVGLNESQLDKKINISSVLAFSPEVSSRIKQIFADKAFRIRNAAVQSTAGRSLAVDISGMPVNNGSGAIDTALILLADHRPSGTAARKPSPAQGIHSQVPGIRIPAKPEAVPSKKEPYDIQKAYADINEELEMARNIQEGLMPEKLPDAINLKSAALYIPAGKVGGDFYDMVITSRQKVAVLIFDVSGHGVPAALIGAMAKMLFMHYLDKSESPAQVFTEVNNRICRFIKSEHYLTAFLGIINPLENTMVYSKAGHVPPIIYHAKNGSVTYLTARGFFIGHAALSSIAEYSDENLHLDPGDKILFYSDGLTEGGNADNELYGLSRLMEAVGKCGTKTPGAFLESILEDQTAFRQGCPLRDDFTMVCIETGSPDAFLKESGFTGKDHPVMLVAYSYKMIEDIAASVLRDMDRMGFPDKYIKRTKVCIYEMLTNAIEHGNEGDLEKKVLIAYKVTPGKIMISVIDEGKGFDYHHLPDPLAPENILKDHGRGIFIVRKYMDEVHFNEKGNRIMAVKYLGAAKPSTK